MKGLLFLILLVSIYTSAQNFTPERPDENAEPKPFEKIYYIDKNNYKSIHSVTTIAKNRDNNFHSDTLRIVYYNASGLQLKNIRFENNKQNSTTLLKYDEHHNLASWQLFEDKFSTLTLYSYNRKGQLQETRQLRIRNVNKKTDTTETSRKSFKYDDLKLIEVLNSNYSNKLIEKYLYNKNKLIYQTGGFISKQFRYDNKQNLISIQEYMGIEVDSSKTMGLKKFTYNKSNNLISDSALTSSNFQKNKFQISQYGYNKNNVLETMNVQFGDSYRRVKFSYLNDRIKDVNVETNEVNSAYLRFWLNHKIEDYYSFPITYQERFSYDEDWNMISKKVYINESLFSEVEYKIQYKK